MSAQRDHEKEIKDFIENDCGIVVVTVVNDYYHRFVSNDYDSLAVIKLIEHERKLERIGIGSAGHQTRIMAAIKKLNNINKAQQQTKSKDSRYVRLNKINGLKLALQWRPDGKTYPILPGKDTCLKTIPKHQWDSHAKGKGITLPAAMNYDQHVYPRWDQDAPQEKKTDVKNFIELTYNHRNDPPQISNQANNYININTNVGNILHDPSQLQPPILNHSTPIYSTTTANSTPSHIPNYTYVYNPTCDCIDCTQYPQNSYVGTHGASNFVERLRHDPTRSYY